MDGVGYNCLAVINGTVNETICIGGGAAVSFCWVLTAVLLLVLEWSFVSKVDCDDCDGGGVAAAAVELFFNVILFISVLLDRLIGIDEACGMEEWFVAKFDDGDAVDDGGVLRITLNGDDDCSDKLAPAE